MENPTFGLDNASKIIILVRSTKYIQRPKWCTGHTMSPNVRTQRGGPKMALKKYNRSTDAMGTIANHTFADNTNLSMLHANYVISDEWKNELTTLEHAVEDINVAIATGASASLLICAKLASIYDLNLLEHSEWSDIRDFGADMFGFKKSSTYTYVKVGQRFLTEFGGIKNEWSDLSGCGASVLGLLTSMTDENIRDLIADGDLSAKGVREFKRGLKAPKTETTNETTTETTNETTTETTNDNMDYDFGVLFKDNKMYIVRDGIINPVPDFQIADTNNIWTKELWTEIYKNIVNVRINN